MSKRKNSIVLFWFCFITLTMGCVSHRGQLDSGVLIENTNPKINLPILKTNRGEFRGTITNEIENENELIIRELVNGRTARWLTGKKVFIFPPNLTFSILVNSNTLENYLYTFEKIIIVDNETISLRFLDKGMNPFDFNIIIDIYAELRKIDNTSFIKTGRFLPKCRSNNNSFGIWESNTNVEGDLSPLYYDTNITWKIGGVTWDYDYIMSCIQYWGHPQIPFPGTTNSLVTGSTYIISQNIKTIDKAGESSCVLYANDIDSIIVIGLPTGSSIKNLGITEIRNGKKQFKPTLSAILKYNGLTQVMTTGGFIKMLPEFIFVETLNVRPRLAEHFDTINSFNYTDKNIHYIKTNEWNYLQ